MLLIGRASWFLYMHEPGMLLIQVIIIVRHSWEMLEDTIQKNQLMTNAAFQHWEALVTLNSTVCLFFCLFCTTWHYVVFLIPSCNGCIFQECVFEDIEVKQNVFRDIEGLVREDVILSSSTSCLVPSNVFSKVQNRSRCLVSHPVS